MQQKQRTGQQVLHLNGLLTRQGRVLSPHLFNLLTEAVMRETLNGYVGGF